MVNLRRREVEKKRHIEVSYMTQADRREKTGEKSTSKPLFGMEVRVV